MGRHILFTLVPLLVVGGPVRALAVAVGPGFRELIEVPIDHMVRLLDVLRGAVPTRVPFKVVHLILRAKKVWPVSAAKITTGYQVVFWGPSVAIIWTPLLGPLVRLLRKKMVMNVAVAGPIGHLLPRVVPGLWHRLSSCLGLTLPDPGPTKVLIVPPALMLAV